MGQLTPDYDISKRLGEGVVYHGWSGHVVESLWVPFIETFPPVVSDSSDIRELLC